MGVGYSNNTPPRTWDLYRYTPQQLLTSSGGHRITYGLQAGGTSPYWNAFCSHGRTFRRFHKDFLYNLHIKILAFSFSRYHYIGCTLTNHSNFNARAKNIFILNQSQIEARQKSTFQNMIDMNKHEMNFRDISQIEIVTQYILSCIGLKMYCVTV